MTSVIVAVVAGLTGILTGLVPSLLVSPRRRRLRLIREESEAYELVNEPRAKKHLGDSLAVNAMEYSLSMTLTPVGRVRNRALLYGPFAASGVLNGLLWPLWLIDAFGVEGTERKIIAGASLALLALGGVLGIALMMAYANATRVVSHAQQRAEARAQAIRKAGADGSKDQDDEVDGAAPTAVGAGHETSAPR